MPSAFGLGPAANSAGIAAGSFSDSSINSVRKFGFIVEEEVLLAPDLLILAVKLFLVATAGSLFCKSNTEESDEISVLADVAAGAMKLSMLIPILIDLTEAILLVKFLVIQVLRLPMFEETRMKCPNLMYTVLETLTSGMVGEEI